MPIRFRVVVSLSLMAVLLFVAQAAWAQEVTAAVTGTVTDPSGAPVADATATATDADRGTVFTTKTNPSGAYSFPRLPVGSYALKVTAPGFQTAVRPPITLVLNQTARVDVQLKIGQVTETVEVSSSAPVLQTETTQVSTIIDASTNDNLPLATRNFIQLTLLTPGAVSVDPQSMNTGANVAEEGGRPYINGNREQANNFLLDGVDNNQASENLAGFTPAPDAIAEFNLITQNASAEFGNYNGGIVNATIKSGTNGYHGDVYEFFRNDIFNANKWENKLNPAEVLPTPRLRWNMFGGTFGGPIRKNKLFFFADYQGGRLDHPASSSFIRVLTPAETTGDFSALLNASPSPTILYNPCAPGTGVSGSPCQLLPVTSRTPFPGNIIPSNMLDPAFTNLVTSKLYPQSIASLSDGFGESINTLGQQFNSDQGDLKIDYNMSQKDRISGRYSRGKQFDPTTNSVALLGNTINEAALTNTSYSWTHTFNPHLLNDARFGVNYVQFTHGNTTFDPSVGAFANTIGIQNGNPAGQTGLPLIGLGGGSITNPGTGLLESLGSANVVESFASTVIQFNDALTYTHGRHLIKTGFQMNRYRVNVYYSGNGGKLGQLLYGGNYTSAGTSGGNPAADWALGLPEDVGRGASTGGWHQRDWLFAGYVQDDWRVTDNLTLNLGLRYEARTPWVEVNNRQDTINKFTGAIEFAGQNGNSRGLYNSVYGLPDFQPRVGFAWTPRFSGGKTVIRGAYTIASYLEGTGTNLRLAQNPPFTQPQVEAKNVATGTPFTTETGFAATAPPTGSPFIGATLLTWDPTVQPAMAQQWNLTVQQQVGNNTTVQVGYVGQHTTHLMVPEWLTQGRLVDGVVLPTPFVGGPNPAGGFGPNQVGLVKDTASVGNMGYNALQAVLQKRYGHDLQTQVSYTFSKCLTNNDGYFGTWGTATETTPAANYWQNLYDPNADWAQCYWDSKHVISAYAIYELPIGRNKQFGRDLPGAVNAVIGNWSVNPIVSFHTGFPIALYGADNSGTGSPAPRPDCNGPVSYPHTVSTAGLLWFDPSSFSQPAPHTFGNCPAQGPVIGPRYSDVDIGLQKNFLITESKRLQFRADFLNAFNHANFGHPGNVVGDSGIGLINTSQDARQIQFALKFYF